MYITFKQLFKLKTLRGAKLISGRGRLFNLIRRCEIVDSLPFNGTIKEDVLLIIKYAPDIKGKTEDFLELVKKAAEKKAAGIVINAGRFTVRIPQSVMEEANKRIFPFISVSRTTSPEQLANEVYKKLEKNEVKREKISRLLDYVLTYDCRPGDKKELIHYGYIPKLRYQAVSAKIIFKDDTKDEEKSKYTETVMEIIREAFEEIDADRDYHQEKRKDANDRLISRKGLIGKGVGFAPLICLFVGYLIIPLVIIGLTSMSGAFSQLGGV